LTPWTLAPARCRSRKRAVYGKNSFRGGELDFRRRHFQPVHGGFLLNPAVRKKVWFQRGNVLDEGCWPSPAPMTSFSAATCLSTLTVPLRTGRWKKLRRLLTPTGALFVGAAEVALAMTRGFAPLNIPASFACRQPSAVPPARPPAWPPKMSLGKKPQLKPFWLKPIPVTKARKHAGSRPFRTGKAPSTAGLETARQLAAEGRMTEAAEICEAHLRDHGASAEAYYLLGRTRDAAGADAQAGEFYRRALYLEPGHCDAMREWARLSERNGNTAHARILRARAGRRKSHNAETTRLVDPLNPKTPPLAMVRTETALVPAGGGAEDFDCWNKIGVSGDGTCGELVKFVHCRNCPVYSAAGAMLLDREPPAGYRKRWTEHFAIEKKRVTPGNCPRSFFASVRNGLRCPLEVFRKWRSNERSTRCRTAATASCSA